MSLLKNKGFQQLCVDEAKRVLFAHVTDVEENFQEIQRAIAEADYQGCPEHWPEQIKAEENPKTAAYLTDIWELIAIAEAKHGRPEHLAAVWEFRGRRLGAEGMALIAPLLRGEVKKKGTGNFQHKRDVNYYAALEVPHVWQALRRYRPDVKFNREFAILITARIFNIVPKGLSGFLDTHDYTGRRHGRKKAD